MWENANMSFMILDTEDIEWVWMIMGKLQLILHPRYAQEGKIEYSVIIRLSHEKEILNNIMEIEKL